MRSGTGGAATATICDTMKPGGYTLYHVEDAELLLDGVLRVRTGGSIGDRLFDGVYDVPPNSPDYDFWLWLTRRLKRRTFSFRPTPGLDEQQIARYRDEYERSDRRGTPGAGSGGAKSM